MAVLGQFDLDAIEQPRIDNRRVLARIALAAMIDLAEIDPIPQEMVQRVARRRVRVMVPCVLSSSCSADSEGKAR